MSPQPTTAPATDAAPVPTKGSPEWLVNRAKELEKERGNLMERIAANRASLRNLLKDDALERDLATFVRRFYPEKEKGGKRSDEAIKATRDARQAARKGE